MQASEYGIQNLQRIVPNIAEWSYEEGEDFDQTQDLYNQVFNQFNRYCGHVIANIGGVIEISKTQDQKEASFTHVNRSKQTRAMDFLKRHLFTTPKWMINEKLVRKFEPDGMVDRIGNIQSRNLNLLFNKDRIDRMAENEALNGRAAYSVYELFSDTRNAIFNSNLDLSLIHI